MGPRAGLEGRKISSPPDSFLNTSMFIALLPLHFHSHPFQPSNYQADWPQFLYCVTLSPFYHPTSLPTLRLLQLFCHCSFTLRSLLHVTVVYFMLQGHRHSPRPS